MHNAAFAACGIDAVYLAFDVTPEHLAGAIAGARGLGIRQLAISIPHKQAVIDHLDEVDPCARRIGAVNTVTLRNGRLIGSNTDWIGAVRALEAVRPLVGARAVVLGAGGTARAVVFGLLERGASVTVLNRTPAHAERLAAELGAVAAGPLDALADLHADVIVNTTSVGLREQRSPVSANALTPGSVVLDAVYDPEQTLLLQHATARGATAIGGKWMLVHQATEQFRAWTGQDAPIDVMSRAFDAATSRATPPA
jgi:shikimate dehydrogenase